MVARPWKSRSSRRCSISRPQKASVAAELCYRRITALLNRERRDQRLPPINRKRVLRRTLEIVKRPNGAAAFEVLPSRWAIEHERN